MESCGNDPTRPWKLEFRSSKRFVIWVVSVGVFTDVFIYGMVVPILPVVLKTRIGIPDEQLQRWMSILLAAFGCAIFIGSPISGYFADKGASRKFPFIIGLLSLAGSTVMFWFARTIASLVIARVLQGLSAAVVWTVGLALVVDTVGKEQVGGAMGWVSMGMTVGTVFGPFMGGILLSRASYHAVFAVAIALVGIDILLRLVMIEQRSARKWIQPQLVAETDALIGAGSQYESFGDDAPSPSASCEDLIRDGGEPVNAKSSPLPGMVRLMCSGKLLLVFAATVVNASLYASFDSVLPLHIMRTFDWGPLGVGLCFLPLFTPSFLSAVIGGAVDRYGARTIAVLGFLISFPVFILLRIITTNSTHDKVFLVIFLFFAGLASVLQMVSLMVEVHYIVESIESEHPGLFGHQGGTAQAYGLYNVAWSGGQVLGPLLAGFLVENNGWRTMVSVFGVMSGVTAMVFLGVYGWKGPGRS